MQSLLPSYPEEVVDTGRRKRIKKRAKGLQDAAFAVGTPYDDVFRTLLIDCSSLVLPLLNETFGTRYTGDEKVVFAQNEHYLKQRGGRTDKRITDSSFTVIGVDERKYLYECQSTADHTILVRIFEYAALVAVEQRTFVGHRMKVQIPQCAVLFLRSTKNTPDRMEIELETPGGTVSFDVQVVKVMQYPLAEIFEKKLLFLIPFYIFSYEKRFPEYDSDAGKLRELQDEYRKIVGYLDRLLENGEITAYTRKAIIEMVNKVLENIARKYRNVKEGVKEVMGGKVLDYEAKRIYTEGEKAGYTAGEKAGEKTGEKAGYIAGKRIAAVNLYKKGMKVEEIAEVTESSRETVEEWLGLVSV